MCGKYYTWNPATCSCKYGKYLASVIDNSVTMGDEIIEDTKAVQTNFNEKKEKKYNLRNKRFLYLNLPFY